MLEPLRTVPRMEIGATAKKKRETGLRTNAGYFQEKDGSALNVMPTS